MDMASLLISLASGAVGGNVAGAAMKDKSLGTLGNSIAGILGGGLGTVILQQLGMAAAGGQLDVSKIIADVAGGGVGGGVLMAVIAVVKGAMAQKA
jgi:uncharacterized membrane protein YeaQ/YmgE (transglycosylase-associated protein family)